MKTLPDEKTLLKMLELFKDAEKGAREICEMSTGIALKYQSRIEEAREAANQSKDVTE